MKPLLIPTLLGATLAVVSVFPASGQGSTTKSRTTLILETVADLKSQLDSLATEETAIAADAKIIAEEERRYIATGELLKGAVANYNREYRAFQVENQRNANEISAHNQAPCSTTQDKPNACDWYEARANRLNTEKKQLADRHKTFELRHKGINDRYAELSAATLDSFRRKKENNFRSIELVGRANGLMQRITDALKQLQVREAASGECKWLAETARLDENGLPILEPASQCLQAVWDGARSHKQLPAGKLKPKPTKGKPNN